jgi:hypothetical protein
VKLTHIGHACLLAETQGVRILSDPWWKGPCFGSQWWIYPPPDLDPLMHGEIDYIYISHGHEDHFHLPTLRTLDRSARLLVTRGAGFAREARALGFEVIEIAGDEARDLGRGLRCRIVPTYGGDTFMTLTDGQETLVNLNDALHPAPAYARRKFTRLLRRLHPVIDYLFCGHGVASHFPNCYVVPGKDREATARKRQLFFNHSWADIVQALEPRFAFPFAADVVLLEDELQWTNEPVHNTTRPPDVFRERNPKSKTAVFDIGCGFSISDGRVLHARLHEPLRLADVQVRYPDRISQANRYGSVREDALEDVRQRLHQSIRSRRDFFAAFPRDYEILVRLRGSGRGLAIRKAGTDIRVEPIADVSATGAHHDLVFTTKLAYLQRSLSTRHGNDLLFVGSGGVFEYSSRDALAQNLHEELMAMVSPFSATGSRVTRSLKSLVKRLSQRDDLDLYNAARWTVFQGGD